MMDDYNVEISMCSTNENKKKLEQAITFETEDALRQLLIGNIIENNPYGKLFARDLFLRIPFVDKSANVLYKLFESCFKISFMNYCLYHMNNDDTFLFNSILNKDLRIMKAYPSLSLYCKCNIVKSIQNEFYNSIINNSKLQDENNLYSLLLQTLKGNDDEIASFYDYIRRAHLYLLANDLKNYKMICPVLPNLK